MSAVSRSPSPWAATTVLLGILGLAACDGSRADRTAASEDQEAPPSARQVVARIDGQAVTVGEVRGLLRHPGTADPARRREALEGAIARRLAAAEARARGLVAAPTEAASRGGLSESPSHGEEAVLRDALYRKIRDGLELSETELRAHYEKTRGRFVERQVRFRRRSFPDRAAAEAAAEALGADGHLDPAESETLLPAAPRDLPTEVMPEALELREVGERTIRGRGEDAAILELVEILPAEPLPFATVRERVEASLRTLRAQEVLVSRLQELRAAADVQIDEATLTDESLWSASEAAPATRPRGRRSVPRS